LHNGIRKLLSDSQIDLHVIKAEPDSDHEIWPASSPNEDVKKEEQPTMFTFVSVNSKEVTVPFMFMVNIFFSISNYLIDFGFYKFLESLSLGFCNRHFQRCGLLYAPAL
jgi:hypothetical protein